MKLNYVLGPDGKTPVPESDLLKWARWFESADRRVKLTYLRHHHVSTRGRAPGRPWNGRVQLFETMVFENDKHEHALELEGRTVSTSAEDSHDMARYATWDEAVAGHDEMVRKWSQLEADADAAVLDLLKKEKT